MNISTLRSMPHLSASSIQSYMGCGLQYKFSRIDKLQREYTSDNLIFGSTIHKVLAEYNQEKLMGTFMSAQELMDLFEALWIDGVQNTPDIKYSKGKDFNQLLRQGKHMLQIFISQVPRDEYEIIAIEEAFSVEIDGLDVPLIGVFDLIEKDSLGTIVVSDYKTMSSSITLNEIDQNLQLSLYFIAIKKLNYTDDEIVLKLDCLMKTKNPQFKQVYTYRNEEDERRTIKLVKSAWNGIQKGIFLPTGIGTWRCRFCEYRNHCLDDWFLN